MSLFTLIAFAFLCAALYYLCPDRFKWMLLLLASYAYYAYCGANALPFILLTTLSTWAGALCIGRIGEQSKAVLKARRAELDSAGKKALKAQAKRRQRAVFFAVLLLNFGVLALLKYTSPLLTAMGRPALNLLLPLGISFYTFQSMGYLIDVYNGKYAPQRNPAKFALFISFFPQLIQGPIARFDQLAAQLAKHPLSRIADIDTSSAKHRVRIGFVPLVKMHLHSGDKDHAGGYIGKHGQTGGHIIGLVADKGIHQMHGHIRSPEHKVVDKQSQRIQKVDQDQMPVPLKIHQHPAVFFAVVREILMDL